MTKYISELFQEFEKLKSKKEKLGFLWDHKNNGVFRGVLQGTFDPDIKWKLPVPEYTQDEAGLNYATLPRNTGAQLKLAAIEVKLNGVTAKTKPSNALYSVLFFIPSGEYFGCCLCILYKYSQLKFKKSMS